MSAEVIEGGLQPEFRAKMGQTELEVLVDFWMGRGLREKSYSPLIEKGLEYIAALEEALASGFLDSLTNPPNFQPLIEAARNVLDNSIAFDLEQYNTFFQEHPGAVMISIGGKIQPVQQVGVEGYNIFPIVDNAIVTEFVVVRVAGEPTNEE